MSSPGPLANLQRRALCRQLTSSASFRARLSIIQPQARRQSTANKDSSEKAGKQPPRPKDTPRPSLARIFASSFRTLGGAFRPRNLRLLLRSNPEELIIALIILAAVVGFGVYVVRIYFTYFYAEQFTKYPEPIAKSLRRALYYSNYNADNKLALKYYRIALEQCEELGLDPFSDDVLGIKIQLAAWLEKIGSYDNATQVLERVLGDCKSWIELMEKSVKEGKIPRALMPPPPPLLLTADPNQPTEPEEEPETLWGKRTRILAKAVGISVKLGELYADEHIMEQEVAHERLTWAVETALGELQRRATESPKEGEGPWMDSDQMGGALESLAHSYERKSQFHLALPLFFQALRLSHDPCHSAVIMNNLSVTFAQHPLHVPVEALLNTSTGQPSPASRSPNVPGPAATRASYLDAARRWATNAHQHASEPQGEQRTPECDEACAVSLCNLGDIASLSGDVAEARRMFEKAVAMSKKVGHAPALQRAEASLRSLS
ncbi:TPR domain-containing protein [Thozetella sp. PMI_491]|nr:TPR domain-containing protein [Thozetella sp. PMI_491]